MLSEVVSKDTLKKVAKAWYGFSVPFSEGSGATKQESLLDKVRKAEAKHNRNNGKEG